MQPEPSAEVSGHSRFPVFVKPCGAWMCPQSLRCLRLQRGAGLSFEALATRKGCPFFIDRRGTALLAEMAL